MYKKFKLISSCKGLTITVKRAGIAIASLFYPMKTLKLLLKKFRALKISLSLKFVIGVAAILTVAMGVTLYFIDRNHKKLVIEQVDLQAKSLFKQIVLTRKWISDHGGIFIEKVPWKDSSPYLVRPEILDVRGKKYVRQSPAMVTKELSTYAREQGLYWFHITSLNLVNPENAPDDFEKSSLEAFERTGSGEFAKIEKKKSNYYYRYIAPLYIEESCLSCHSRQGYQLGDLRGAISVSVPMDSAFAMINSGRRGMVLSSIVTVGMLMIVLYVMMKELVLRPVNQLKGTVEDFSRGKKTRTTLISTGDELEDLSNSFLEMSRRLTEYHQELEDKIHQATQRLEQANDRLTELNEKKSDFIARISHELRTPMTSIKGAMDYIASKISRKGGDSEDLMEFLAVIKQNADRLIRMVNDTLDLEMIESGAYDLHYSQVPMSSLVKEVVISFQSDSSKKNVVFKITANPQTQINADEDRIRQVLINLVSNAIKYSPDNAEIDMSVKESERNVTVAVKDCGPRIPAGVQEKIFDKFYTLGKRHGTGLGLAICRGIIEAHGGEIGVADNKGSGGNTFYFSLPRVRR